MAPTVFILGATGFVGCHVLDLLAREHPDFPIICLLRDASPDKTAFLQTLNPNVKIVEGTLDDGEPIARTAEQVDIVIHLAHSDHKPSVETVLAGLTKKAATGLAQPPVYLHMSGCGIIADNVKGERVDDPKVWSDIGLSLEDCPPENTHLASDRLIVEAGARSEHRLRTCILFPGLIYGIGKTQRSGAWVPVFSSLAIAAGHSGTWGPGEVSQCCIHVQDVASAVLSVLDATLEGFVKGGTDGLFFVTSQEPTMTWREINSVMGDVMYSKGLVKEPGVRPFPPEITEPLGQYGWSLLGSNAMATADRLGEMGWEPVCTRKEPLKDVIYEMLDRGIPSDSA